MTVSSQQLLHRVEAGWTPLGHAFAADLLGHQYFTYKAGDGKWRLRVDGKQDKKPASSLEEVRQRIVSHAHAGRAGRGDLHGT